MRLKFASGKQKELLTKYKELKKCPWKHLIKVFNVDWRTVRRWRDENCTIPSKIFKTLSNEFPQLIEFKKFITESKRDNWGQVKGAYKANKTIKKKMKNDKNFRKMWAEKCRIGGVNNIKKGLIKNWEVGFRNIGRRKFTGPNGERMFTKTEKKIAEYFSKYNIPYKYEPLIQIGGRNYFPDFLIKRMIIERCGMISRKYLSSLKKKLKDYKKWDGQVVIILPKKIKKVVNRHIKIPKDFIVIVEDEKFREPADIIQNLLKCKGLCSMGRKHEAVV